MPTTVAEGGVPDTITLNDLSSIPGLCKSCVDAGLVTQDEILNELERTPVAPKEQGRLDNASYDAVHFLLHKRDVSGVLPDLIYIVAHSVCPPEYGEKFTLIGTIDEVRYPRASDFLAASIEILQGKRPLPKKVSYINTVDEIPEDVIENPTIPWIARWESMRIEHPEHARLRAQEIANIIRRRVTFWRKDWMQLSSVDPETYQEESA